MRHLVLIIALLAPAAATAQGDCPALPPQTDTKNALYADLRLAAGPAQAQALSGQLWEIWLTAPDARAQQMLDLGMARRQMGDSAGSLAALTELIAYCPAYAEGYNQRAFTAYLAQDFESALADLDLALAREPRHLGALTGKALTLIGMGRTEAAQMPLREALRLNRWLSERALLTGPMEEET